jgi:DNA-binding protein HU-beta
VNKNELVAKMSEISGLTKADSQRALDAFTKAVEHSLSKSGDVRLVGFGTFSVVKRAATTGRNPRTGAVIKISASKRVKFKAGKGLVDSVN